MKKFTVLFIALFAFLEIMYAQTIAIPDNNFEQALIDLNIDTNGVNNSVLISDIEGVTTLDVRSKNISDLSGIEGFVALTNLRCNNNNLTTLDVSQNAALSSLRCFANQLTNLDLSQNTALTYLQCQDNQLTSLNVQNGNNSNFTIFIANVNPNLTCIQVDDVAYATENWKTIDPASSFNEDCSTLSIEDVIATNNVLQISNYDESTIKVKTATNTRIKQLNVYNTLGKLLISTQPNKSECLLQASTFKQGTLLFFKVKLDNNQLLHKKHLKI